MSRPSSLNSRILLILLGAVIAVQLLSFIGLVSMRSRETRDQLYALMAADVAFVRNFLRQQAPADREVWLKQMQRGYYRLVLEPTTHARAPAPHAALERTLRGLAAQLPADEVVERVSLPPPAGGDALPALAVQLDAQDTLLFVFERDPPFSPPTTATLLLYALGVSLPIVGVVWFTTRLATRPLGRFADAAARLGRDLHAPAVPEEGPAEVVRAAQAFNRMQAALQHHFDERTQLLAAISHDLKTPLTRLRLRVEGQLAPALADSVARDIDAMQSLIQDGLDHAASSHLQEELRRVDLARLMEALVDEARDLDADIGLEGQVSRPVLAAPRALRRVLQNLIDNALRYGGATTVRLSDDGTHALLCIDDDGPGIPPELLERVFDPFFRLEQSRSRETGGTGLGLAIARNLVQAQNGTLELVNRAGGGLRAQVRLPLCGPLAVVPSGPP